MTISKSFEELAKEIQIPEKPNTLPSTNVKDSFTSDTTDDLIPSENFIHEGSELQAKEQDLAPFNLNTIEKQALLGELDDCDVYLKNIHKGFKYANSVNSLLKLVAGGIGVHKHRRQVMNEVKNINGKGQLDFDQNGNPIKP